MTEIEDIKGRRIRVVQIPSKKIYKLKRRRLDEANLESVVDNGSFQLGEGHMLSQFVDLASTFDDGLSGSKGISLDVLLAPKLAAAESAPMQTPASSSKADAMDDEPEDEDFD